MKAIFCDNLYQGKWNDFVKNNSADFGLLQSYQWGILVESRKLSAQGGYTSGAKVCYRVVVTSDNDEILALAQVIIQPLKLGKTYFYLPRGPILADNKLVAEKQAEILELLFATIREKAKKNGAIFLRMDPAWQDSETLQNVLRQSDFKFVGQVQPKSTLILDLRQTEEELLKNMKPKVRYNIKVAQKFGVTIDEGEKYFADFWRLMGKTSSRQEIVQHSESYYKTLLNVLGQFGLAKLVVAKYQDRVITANIIIDIGNWRVYLHGASDYDNRDKMAPFLLQWQSIIDAKGVGKKFYDFWGVDEIKWPGVTRFKIGFAPQNKIITYIGAWDKVYSRFWYLVYKIAISRR